MSTSTFTERARDRVTMYSQHMSSDPGMRQTVVPEDLRGLPPFVELASERQAIETARSRVLQEQQAWEQQWQQMQNNATALTRATLRAAELALEAGDPLPELPIPVVVRPQSAAGWPLAELGSLSSHWNYLHRALDAHERALVIEHGRSPLR